MTESEEKVDTIKTETIVRAFILVAVICLLMMVNSALEIQGIPGPLLYFQKQAVIKKIGEDNFEKMAKVISPLGLAVICANGNNPLPSVAAAVQAYNDKNGKQVDKFINALALSKQEHDTLDRYFYLYFKKKILKDPKICMTLKEDIAAGKYNP